MWRRGDGFTQGDVRTYLGCAQLTLTRLLRATGAPRTGLLTREQAARVILEWRRRQGAKLIKKASRGA